MSNPGPSSQTKTNFVTPLAETDTTGTATALYVGGKKILDLPQLSAAQASVVAAQVTANGGSLDPNSAPYPTTNSAGTIGAELATDAQFRTTWTPVDNARQVILTQTGPGAATIGLPQNISINDSPVFAGVVDGSDAAPGKVGEYMEQVIAVTAVSLTTGVAANGAQLALTPGDWDVDFMGMFAPAATISGISVALGLVTAPTLPAMQYRGSMSWQPAATLTINPSIPSSRRRVSISTAGTVFGVLFANFTSTCTGGGWIRARRVR